MDDLVKYEDWREEQFKSPKFRFWYHAHHMIEFVTYEVPHEIKWAWQRVFRGWDDRVVWSIDTHITDYMPTWLEQLKRDKMGIPLDMFVPEDFEEDGNTKEEAEGPALERWISVLDQMIEGFKAAQLLQEYDYSDDFEYDNLNRSFQRGMKLFTENFFNLWD